MKVFARNARDVADTRPSACAKGDILIRTSAEPSAADAATSAPFTGVVVEVGEAVAGFRRGDRVCGLTRRRATRGALTVSTGTHADHVVVKLPNTVDDTAALALPTAGLAASACVSRLDEYAEQFILVVGITGPIGQFTAQLAVMRGAVVIGVGEGASLAHLDRIGATALVDLDRSRPDAAAHEVRRRFGNNFDVVVDVTGDAAHPREFGRVVRPGGRYLTTSPNVAPEILREENVSVATITFDQGLGGLQAELERLVGFVAAKKLRAPELPVTAR